MEPVAYENEPLVHDDFAMYNHQRIRGDRKKMTRTLRHPRCVGRPRTAPPRSTPLGHLGAISHESPYPQVPASHDIIQPEPRSRGTAVVYKNDMFVFGGCGYMNTYTGSRFRNDVFVYRLQSKTWHRLGCTGYFPSPRIHHTTVIRDEKVVLYGGMKEDGLYLNDMFVFCLKPPHTWKKAKVNVYVGEDYSPQLPQATTPFLCCHSASVHTSRNSMLVFGGRTPESLSGHLYEFSFATQCWKRIHGGGPPHEGAGKVAVLPQPTTTRDTADLGGSGIGQAPLLHGHSSTVYHNVLYVYGGYTYAEGNYYHPNHSIFAFDFVQETWIILQVGNQHLIPKTVSSYPPLPSPEAQNVKISHSSLLYCFDKSAGTLYVVNTIENCKYLLDLKGKIRPKEWKKELCKHNNNIPTNRDYAQITGTVSNNFTFVYGGEQMLNKSDTPTNGIVGKMAPPTVHTTRNFLNSLYLLDLSIGEWQSLQSQGGDEYACGACIPVSMSLKAKPIHNERSHQQSDTTEDCTTTTSSTLLHTTKITDDSSVQHWTASHTSSPTRTDPKKYLIPTTAYRKIGGRRSSTGSRPTSPTPSVEGGIRGGAGSHTTNSITDTDLLQQVMKAQRDRSSAQKKLQQFQRPPPPAAGALDSSRQSGMVNFKARTRRITAMDRRKQQQQGSQQHHHHNTQHVHNNTYTTHYKGHNDVMMNHSAAPTTDPVHHIASTNGADSLWLKQTNPTGILHLLLHEKYQFDKERETLLKDVENKQEVLGYEQLLDNVIAEYVAKTDPSSNIAPYAAKCRQAVLQARLSAEMQQCEKSNTSISSPVCDPTEGQLLVSSIKDPTTVPIGASHSYVSEAGNGHNSNSSGPNYSNLSSNLNTTTASTDIAAKQMCCGEEGSGSPPAAEPPLGKTTKEETTPDKLLLPVPSFPVISHLDQLQQLRQARVDTKKTLTDPSFPEKPQQQAQQQSLVAILIDNDIRDTLDTLVGSPAVSVGGTSPLATPNREGMLFPTLPSDPNLTPLPSMSDIIYDRYSASGGPSSRYSSTNTLPKVVHSGSEHSLHCHSVASISQLPTNHKGTEGLGDNANLATTTTTSTPPNCNTARELTKDGYFRNEAEEGLVVVNMTSSTIGGNNSNLSTPQTINENFAQRRPFVPYVLKKGNTRTAPTRRTKILKVLPTPKKAVTIIQRYCKTINSCIILHHKLRNRKATKIQCWYKQIRDSKLYYKLKQEDWEQQLQWETEEAQFHKQCEEELAPYDPLHEMMTALTIVSPIHAAIAPHTTTPQPSSTSQVPAKDERAELEAELQMISDWERLLQDKLAVQTQLKQVQEEEKLLHSWMSPSEPSNSFLPK